MPINFEVPFDFSELYILWRVLQKIDNIRQP